MLTQGKCFCNYSSLHLSTMLIGVPKLRVLGLGAQILAPVHLNVPTIKPYFLTPSVKGGSRISKGSGPGNC